MSQGWFKIHRELLDHGLWHAEPFTKGQAWVDLVGNANHKPGSFWVRGIEVRVGRGQLAWSEISMSKRWKWSRGKVRRYLKTLESKHMIEQQTSQLTTVITICKYEHYQGGDAADKTADSTPDGTTGGTTDGQQTVHKQECKNDKNVEEEGYSQPKPDPIPYQDIMNLWCQMLPELPAPNKLTEARKKKLKARWHDTVMAPTEEGPVETKCNTMDFWQRFFRRIKASPFLLGENPRGWQAEFNWVLKEENFNKIVEGNYAK